MDNPSTPPTRLGRADVVETLKTILVEDVGVRLPREQMDDGIALFGMGLGMDSIDTVELFLAINTRFGIRLEETAALREAMRTLDGLACHVLALLGEDNAEHETLPPPGASRLQADEPLRRALEDRAAAFDDSDLGRACFSIRRRVALASRPSLIAFRIRGKHAFNLVDAASSRDVFVRGGGVLATFFLNDDGKVFADVILCAEGTDFWLLAEGPTPGEFATYLESRRDAAWDATIDDLSATHTALDLCGPFAWQGHQRLHGGAYVGLTFLAFARMGDVPGITLRLGRVGEHAYTFVVPKAEAPSLRLAIEEVCADLELAYVSESAIDVCSLEVGAFVASIDTLRNHTPRELRQSWRVGRHRTAPGIAALVAQDAEQPTGAPKRRESCATWLLSVSRDSITCAVGDVVHAQGVAIGTVWCVRRAASRGRMLIIAGIERQWAGPGLRVTIAERDFVAVVPPVVASASVQVDPRRHGFATRIADGLGDFT